MAQHPLFHLYIHSEFLFASRHSCIRFWITSLTSLCLLAIVVYTAVLLPCLHVHAANACSKYPHGHLNVLKDTLGNPVLTQWTKLKTTSDQWNLVSRGNERKPKVLLQVAVVMCYVILTNVHVFVLENTKAEIIFFF